MGAFAYAQSAKAVDVVVCPGKLYTHDVSKVIGGSEFFISIPSFETGTAVAAFSGAELKVLQGAKVTMVYCKYSNLIETFTQIPKEYDYSSCTVGGGKTECTGRSPNDCKISCNLKPKP